MIRLLLFLVVLLSCGTETEIVYRYIEYRDLGTTPEEAWVCYNPQSQHHGKLCTPDCYGNSTDYTKFCWKITREDCVEISNDWEQKNCHFFD